MKSVQPNKNEMKRHIMVGDTVDYHSVIGGPVTSTGHTVRSVQLSPNNFGRDVAWITDKKGYVALDALTHSSVNAQLDRQEEAQ